MSELESEAMDEVRAGSAIDELMDMPMLASVLAVKGLGLHRYLGGPWEPLGSWSFRGPS